jgi:hypothetical protein
LAFARTSVLTIVVGLGACEGRPPERYVQHAPALAALHLRVPYDAVIAYNVVLDHWLFATPHELAIIDVAPAAAIASPDALRHVLEVERRVTAAVESRESLSDGYATTISVHAAPSERVMIVVRQLGNRWLRCAGAPRLCKGLRRR